MWEIKFPNHLVESGKMDIQGGTFEVGTLYLIKTVNSEVSGVVQEVRSDSVSIGPDSQVVPYAEIISCEKVVLQGRTLGQGAQLGIAVPVLLQSKPRKKT